MGKSLPAMSEESALKSFTSLPDIGTVYEAHKCEGKDWSSGIGYGDMLRIRATVKRGNGPLKGRCLEAVVAVACRLEEAGVTGHDHIETLLCFFIFVFRFKHRHLEEAWDAYFKILEYGKCSARTLNRLIL
ncbi:hypothetical protein BJY01DRAFT_224155 [Aspergillus pseudoustus]|uniref:Uncharacterized protein n=1 Tax=Aspergillus pseudoustus TaxID=1810923 RepID=A0ABR4J3U6_9EURO